jgi:hypothetical protein
MPTAHTLKPTTALKPATRVAPASARPAPAAKSSGPVLSATVLWAAWFGAVALMLTATLGR